MTGVWASHAITRQAIEDALVRHGFDAGDRADIVNARAFVDYIVYELAISGHRWTETEIADGLPWGFGWTGDYERTGPNTIIATKDERQCDVRLKLSMTAGDLAIRVASDDCGGPDLLAQIAIYEAATFHKVEGPGAPDADLYSRQDSVDPLADLPSSSGQRLRAWPLGSLEGAPLGYLEYLPPSYDKAGKSPLLVALHGSGQSGNGGGSALRALYELGLPLLMRDDNWPDTRPFVVLMPQHNASAPAVCITPAEIADFLTFAIAHYDVDPARVYLTGLSCGAIGAWNYLAEHQDVVAAAVLIAGGGYGPVDSAGCAIRSVPIWALHGGADDVIPPRYAINSVARLQACADPAAEVRLTIYPTADHDSWTRTYDLTRGFDIYRWLLSYSN